MTALSEAVRAELRHLLEHEPEYLRHLLQHEAGTAHAAEQLSTGALGASSAGESAGTAAAAGGGESGGGLAGAGGESAGGLAGLGAADAGGGGADFASDAGGTSGDVGGDTMTPSYLYIDATGKTYGLFSGGVVIPESPTLALGQANQVEWTSDGTPTGTKWESIVGWFDNVFLNHNLALATWLAPGQQGAILALQSANGGSQITVQGIDAGHNGALITLIDSLSESSFPQLPTTLKTQLFWGHFTAGSIAPGAGNSGGYAVTKTAVGQYTIAWTNHFTSAGYALIPVAVGGYCDVLAGSQAAGSVVVELRSFADALTDLPWNFLALGVAA